MLSDKFIAMLQEYRALERKMVEQLEEETDDKYSLCTMSRAQLWANPDTNHDLADLERLVGPLTFDYSNRRYNAYKFNLGGVSCSILIDKAIMSDSRGGSDDVSTDEEA